MSSEWLKWLCLWYHFCKLIYRQIKMKCKVNEKIFPCTCPVELSALLALFYSRHPWGKYNNLINSEGTKILLRSINLIDTSHFYDTRDWRRNESATAPEDEDTAGPARASWDNEKAPLKAPPSQHSRPSRNWFYTYIFNEFLMENQEQIGQWFLL